MCFVASAGEACVLPSAKFTPGHSYVTAQSVAAIKQQVQLSSTRHADGHATVNVHGGAKSSPTAIYYA